MSQLAIGSTDEARQLVEDGTLRPGDASLDRPVDSMTDRQIAEETLLHLRIQRDVVGGLVSDLMSSPLGAMLKGGKSPLSMFMGR